MTTYLTSINNRAEVIEKTLIDLGYQLTDKFSLFANFSSIEIESLYKEINIVSQEVISTQKNITRRFTLFAKIMKI
jgi:hypothetical protein